MDGETIDSLRVHVRRGLDRFCTGQYFMEYGLQETEKLIPDNVNTDDLEGSGLNDKKSPFQVFLKAVASEIVKEKGVTKGRKKQIKDYLEILQAFAAEWVEYISKNMRKKQRNKGAMAAKKAAAAANTPDNNGSTNTGKSVDATSGGTTPVKKKGGKKGGTRGPYKKRKQKGAEAAAVASSGGAAATGATSAPPNNSNKRQKVTPMDIDAARREFEEEKQEVMNKVPTKNKKLFNQVGFAKWGKTNLPAMALNPFSVPPGDIRDQWLKMYHNVVGKDRISKMGHLVWWIGPQTDGQSSYSVVPNNGFMSYEEAERKNMTELPSKIKKLLDRGAELNKTQQETVESLRILNELALQSKEEREHPRSDFLEEDYWGLDEEELKAYGAVEDDTTERATAAAATARVHHNNDDDDDEEELLDDEEDLMESSSLEGKKKKKRGKKRKKEEVIDEDEDHTEIVYDDIEEVPVPVESPPKKKKKKEKSKLERGRKKKKKKTEAAGAEGIKQEEDGPSSLAQEDGAASWDRASDMEVDLSVAAAKAAQAAAAAEVEKVLEEASVASADSALVDSDYGDEDEFDDKDEQLPEGDGEDGVKTKKMKKKGSKKKDKAGKEDKDEKKSKKKKNKEKKEKKEKTPKEPKKRSKAAEQREFERCEDEYLPLVERLQVAKNRKDVKEIQELLETLLPIAEDFTSSFFSEYDIPGLMKTTKLVLEDSKDIDLSIYKKLWNTMKASYQAKVKLVPEGFKAKKRRRKKTPAKDSSERSSEDELEATPAVKEENNNSALTTPARPPQAVPVTDPAPEDTPSSPPLRVPIKEGKRPVTESVKSVEKSVPPPKPKPKKFSVMDFMSKKKENKPSSSASGAEKSSAAPSSGSSNKKTTPSWVTAPLSTPFDHFVDSDRREDRLFALEFLLQAAAHFPANKGVNEDSVARSLEMAIFEWSKSNKSSLTSTASETYWDKVHAIVAALTGKRDIGTLVGMIMEGHFSTPRSIITLSQEDLEHSFEGEALDL